MSGDYSEAAERPVQCTLNTLSGDRCVGGKVILPSLGKDFFTSVGKQFFT